jgi:pyruvate dehydrogenase E1 component alpha subunit
MSVIEKTLLIKMFEKMVLIRKFEEVAQVLEVEGKAYGGCHLCWGQEACAVGACLAIRDDDYVAITHRGDGHNIVKCGDEFVKQLMAELYGKATGCCKGKGGQMHMGDWDKNMLNGCAVVGGNLPMAAGIGLAIKMKGTDQVCIVSFGDGASNQGTFHESLNLASIWKLPVIYVCENNQWGISTPLSHHMNIKEISARAKSYGIPGVTVDGNDVIAVYEAVGEAVKRARAGEGPTLLELITYQMKGNWGGDPGGYYPPGALEMWCDEEHDPIMRFRKKLLQTGILADDEGRKIEEECDRKIKEAVRFAEESPWAKLEEALKDVFVEEEVEYK